MFVRGRKEFNLALQFLDTRGRLASWGTAYFVQWQLVYFEDPQ